MTCHSCGHRKQYDYEIWNLAFGVLTLPNITTTAMLTSESLKAREEHKSVISISTLSTQKIYTMTPFFTEHHDDEYDLDYDLDLSTGGFEEHEIIAPALHEPVNVSTISFAVDPPPPPPPPRKRSVSFAPMVGFRDVLSIDDYTPEEYEATWLDPNEMEKIKDQVLNEAMLLDVGVESKTISTRGLESRTKKGLEAKRRNRANAYAAVFFEIDSQEEKELISEQMIADAYSIYSSPCAKVAQTIGKIDALEAMRIHSEEEEEDNTTSFAKQGKKKTNNSTIDLESHFRRTRKRNKLQKQFLNLSPRNGFATSAA